MAEPHDAAASPEPAAEFEPAVSGGLAAMLPGLLFDVVLPVATFFVLTTFGVPVLLALVAGGIFPAINVVAGFVRSRRVQPLGIIVMAFLVLGTAGSLISGSVFFTQVKESILTASFGLLCLGSLAIGRRPLMFHILRQFIAGTTAAGLHWWEGLWQREPFRLAMRRVTAVWGIAYLVEAAVRVAFAWLLTPAQVAVLSPTMAFGVTIALMVWTRRFMLALRARQQAAQPR